MFVFELFFELFVSFCCCFNVSPSICKLLYSQSKNTYNNIKQTYKLKGKHKKKQLIPTTTPKNNRNLPARPLEIFIFRGGSWAGNPVFLFCLCFSLSCSLSCLFFFVCFVLCVRLVFLSFCIYNRKTHINTLTTNITTRRKTTTKTNIKNGNLPARPLERFIFREGSWAGNPVFMLFYVFL